MKYIRRYGLAILIIFHLVGLLGMTLVDREFFAQLTPMNLLLSAAVLIAAQEKRSIPLAILFLITFTLGYGVELLGTQTGFPFGDYHYGPALGPLLWEVPIVIGVNWFLMVVSSGAVAKRITAKNNLQLPLAAALMVGIDLLIEPVAPQLDYWYWAQGGAPVLNFAGWFIVSLFMQWVFQKTIVKQSNNLARPYFVIVCCFFALLNLML